MFKFFSLNLFWTASGLPLIIFHNPARNRIVASMGQRTTYTVTVAVNTATFRIASGYLSLTTAPQNAARTVPRVASVRLNKDNVAAQNRIFRRISVSVDTAANPSLVGKELHLSLESDRDDGVAVLIFDDVRCT